MYREGRSLDTKALRIFDAVAGAGSISRAAEDLNYVQSNVSGRILQLEEELGVALFHRKSRGVALTPAGRVLQDYAGRVLHLVPAARRRPRIGSPPLTTPVH